VTDRQTDHGIVMSIAIGEIAWAELSKKHKKWKFLLPHRVHPSMHVTLVCGDFCSVCIVYQTSIVTSVITSWTNCSNDSNDNNFYSLR